MNIKQRWISDTEVVVIYNTLAVEGTIGLIFLLGSFELHPYANRRLTGPALLEIHWLTN